MGADAVRSVERSFTILKCFTPDDQALNLGTISEMVDLPASSVLRLLMTLVSAGVLRRNEDRSYSLGNELYLLGTVTNDQFLPRKIALPYMLHLREETREAVTLYGIERDCRVCYEHLPGLLTLRCIVRVGERLPLWAGAAGKAMLAYTSPEIIEREAGKLSPLTGATITDRAQFLDDLALVRCQDYAVSRGELDDGILSIAVPIFDHTGEPQLCLSITAPSARIGDEAIPLLAARLQEASAQISKELF